MAAKGFVLELPRTGYRRLMPFNRFFVERIDNFFVVHFGFLNQSGVLLDRYSSCILRADLEMWKPSMMDYLGKLGSLGDAPPPWQPAAGQGAVELFNHLGVTSSRDFAETTLNNIVVRAVSEFQRGPVRSGSFPVEGIALLRSSRHLQQHLIRELYLDL